jgi:glycosyltransferase involved in cell wall biosynthesis
MALTQLPIGDYERQPGKAPPRVSVITTVYNGEKTLARAIASMRAQQLPDLEYVIADGGSSDSTLNIIQANADIVHKWESEPDRGISDGFNKGIALSAGKYIALLNADDWLSLGQIAFGVEALERTGADFVFGDLVYYDAAGAPLHTIKGDANYARRIGYVMPVLNHPTVIVRRTAYEAHGLFDLNLRYAMNYELPLRFHRAGRRAVYDSWIIRHMTLAGQSDLHGVAGLAEVRDSSIRYGASPSSAWLRYFFRVFKSLTRRLLERLLPRAVIRRLRRRVNRDLADFAL